MSIKRLHRIPVSLALVSVAALLLLIELPFLDGTLITVVFAHPIAVLVLCGWYIGRPTIAAIGHWRHTKTKPIVVDKSLYPSLSIIIPAYNEENTIHECIESIDEQDYPGELEILIVDDGSTDNTWDVLQLLEDTYSFVRIFTKENGGIGDTQNYALEHTQNDVILSVDADTILLPNALTEVAKPLIDPDVVAVAGNVQIGNATESMWTRLQAIEYPLAMELARMFQSQLHHLLCVSGCFSTIRREAVEEVGGWNERDHHADDFDISIRLHRQGKIYFTPDAVALTEAPATFLGWAMQRIRWAHNGLRTMIHQRQAQLNPEYSLAGLFGLPLKLFLAGVLMLKVTGFAYTLITQPINESVEALSSIVIGGYVFTASLALVLFAALVLFMVDTRSIKHWWYLPMYITFYRVLHVGVKVVGLTWATLTMTGGAIKTRVVPSSARTAK